MTRVGLPIKASRPVLMLLILSLPLLLILNLLLQQKPFKLTRLSLWVQMLQIPPMLAGFRFLMQISLGLMLAKSIPLTSPSKGLVAGLIFLNRIAFVISVVCITSPFSLKIISIISTKQSRPLSLQLIRSVLSSLTVHRCTVSVNLSINATDALNISIVYANITRPGIVLPFRVNLSREGTTNNFSARYKIHNITGLYNITFFANDTRGNINFTNSTNISVTDTAAPSARYRAPVPQITKEANASIGVSFNVSELVNVSTAYANITRPNISTIYRLNLTLGQASGPIRNMSASYLVQRTPGKYNFTFWANDLSGNILSSSTLNFTNITVQDTTAPGIIARGPTPQSSKEVNASLMVSWNLSEVVNISLAYVNVTRPNISTMYRLNVTLGQNAGDTRNMSGR